MRSLHLLPRRKQNEPPPSGRLFRLARAVILVTAAVAVAVPSALIPSVGAVAAEAEPLPKFAYAGEVTVAENLSYNPTGEFIFPSVFHAGAHLANPLAEWYLYYAPHENPGGVSLMYSDSLSGPWTEYAANPVISNVWSPIYSVNHVSSPDAIWNEQEQKMFLYFHGGNDQTRFATSDDGVTFDYGATAVDNAMGGTNTTETSYARVFAHPDASSTYNYGMFYMENTTANSRRIRLAESVDGRTWTVRPTPVVYPGTLDAGNVSAANLWEWGGQLYVIYHASSGKSFARPIDATLSVVGEPVVLHASSGVGDDTGRVAAPEIVTDETGTYLFYESGLRLSATIRYAKAADVATPAPAFALKTTGTATTSCVGEVPTLRVEANNGSTARTDIRVTTPLGEKKFSGVSPSGQAVANFTGTNGSLAAGQATLTSFARVDGLGYSSTTNIAFPAVACDEAQEPANNTPPTVKVTGVSVDTYEIGSEPRPGCAVTDAEDNGETASPAVSPASGAYGQGARTVTCTYTDSGGQTATDTITYTVVDTGLPTLIGAPANEPNAEGWYRSDVTVQWEAADAGTGIDPATVPGNDIITTEGSNQTTTATVADRAGNTTTATSAPPVNIDKTAPNVSTPFFSVNPKSIDESTSLSATVSDSLSGVLGGEFFLDSDPGEGNGTPLSLSLDKTELAHTFGTTLTPGTYTVGVRSVDAAGNWSATTMETLVVYNPSGGFITGSGHTASPAGAWTTDPAADDRSTFSFNAKYNKGATTPAGKFQFKAGGLDFVSSTYDWLVISGAQTELQGSGTVNGVTGYKFQLTATDGTADGQGAKDQLRIKISKDGSKVYDNLPAYADHPFNGQALTGGSIVIHTK